MVKTHGVLEPQVAGIAHGSSSHLRAAGLPEEIIITAEQCRFRSIIELDVQRACLDLVARIAHAVGEPGEGGPHQQGEAGHKGQSACQQGFLCALHNMYLPFSSVLGMQRIALLFLYRKYFYSGTTVYQMSSLACVSDTTL